MPATATFAISQPINDGAARLPSSPVVETLASFGAATWLGEQGQVVGVNNNTDFYRAVREGRLTSTATPVHRGRMQQVWVVETVDADGRTAARGQVRLQNLGG